MVPRSKNSKYGNVYSKETSCIPSYLLLLLEGLNWLFQKAKQQTLMKVMQIEEDGPCATHLSGQSTLSGPSLL